ncbi:MAG: gas vesicle protein GvpD P-loop domain-containing protein, partial [Candidatus Thermoplasmatota archaeon]
MTDLRVIPQEVRDFFAKPGGRSLLVKGSPGTGKTTFALQLLEMLAEPEKSFYLSTRVSDESLYRQFPWLKEKEMRNRIIDAGRVLLETLAQPEEGTQEYDEEAAHRLSTAKDFLRAIGEDALAPPTKVDRTHLGVLIERIRMPEVERIYDRIEAVLPQRAMLVVDSIEGITGKYGLDREELVFCLQKDLVEHSNTNVLFVTESGQHDSVEYLVDGVISLSHEVINDKRVRHLYLTKLRATEIRQPSYLVTLRNGRFCSFDQFIPDQDRIGGEWIPY